MFASLSSRVYVLGALGAETANLVSCKVFYFDTNHEEGWKRGPDMLMARDFNGKAVSLDGKIYVLGGLDDSEREPFGEVFDLVKNEWEPLTPLPDYIDREAYIYGPVVTYGLEGDKKIVIGNSCSGTGRFVYHVKSGTWEGFEPEISYPERGKALGVGNVMYWTDAGKLQAINMKNGRRYRGRIKGSELRVQGLDCPDCFHARNPEPELFHLGGRKFCFLTLHAIRGGLTKVRCSKFEVSKRLHPPLSDTHNYGYFNTRVTFVLDRPLNSFKALGLLL